VARVQAKMWIVALILMATVSIPASAAPLRLSCKGNALKIGAENPEPATVSVTIDDRWVTVENYPSAERLLGGVEDDIWIFGGRTRETAGLPRGQINRITGHTEIEIGIGSERWSFEGVCHKAEKLF
jgi:hypothetical protein